MKQDPDYEWLLSHKPENSSLKPRADLAEKVAVFLKERIQTGKLPYTVGVFGGWGSGKTTFLALLADQMRSEPDCRIIYFNSWKYAGFMEIVPSLIYKIFQYGVADTDENRNKAAMRVLLSLGREYSDRFGKWAEERVGVNPVELFKDVHHLAHLAKEGEKMVRPELMQAYYTQVDKAQDALKEVLGEAEAGKAVKAPLVVLIDELDRCDPDEAFNVIKQMRVLFAMRRLPVAFVVCANPEPIGLAIKHRYGLESETGDYEARRILEKFVDAYEDFSEPAPLGELALALWKEARSAKTPWIVEIDERNGDAGFRNNTVKRARVTDVFSTDIPFYANLRVLQKSFRYLNGRDTWNRHLLWTLWHLELATQIDPQFRKTIRTLATQIQHMARSAYGFMEADVCYRVDATTDVPRLHYYKAGDKDWDKGRTLFSIFRSYFWESGRQELSQLSSQTDPESREQARSLQALLADSRKMDFVISLCLLPFPDAPKYSDLLKTVPHGRLPSFGKHLDEALAGQFGWTLAKQ